MPSTVNISQTASIGPDGLWAGDLSEIVPPTNMAQLADALNWVRADLRKIYSGFAVVYEFKTGVESTLASGFEAQMCALDARLASAQVAIAQSAAESAKLQISASIAAQSRSISLQFIAADEKAARQYRDLLAALAAVQSSQERQLATLAQAFSEAINTSQANAWPILWASFRKSVQAAARRLFKRKASN